MNTVDLHNMVAIRKAGRSLIVARFDPKKPISSVDRKAEIVIPVSEIDATSGVKKEGDRGILTIPMWLVVDRGIEHLVSP